MAAPTAAPPAAPPPERTILGYPRWFATLFLVDMWERFSFYGMHALLVLFASAAIADGGLGLPDETANMLFGIYLATVFLLPTAGGWLGDRVLGAQRATLWGGVVIALGHFCMAVPGRGTAFAGLGLIAAGTGILKPNIAVFLAKHYGPDDSARREAAFAVFYMSVQISALVAPLVTGFLGERIGWHYGFGAAGVGMTLGVVQYLAGSRGFGTLGRAPTHPLAADERARIVRRGAIAAGGSAVALLALSGAGWLRVELVLPVVGLAVITLPVRHYLRLRRSPLLDAEGRARLQPFVWLFFASALFWMGFAQSGSVLSLFARDATDRDLFGFVVPASWFQAVIPLFVLIFAPLFAWLWLRLGPRAGVAQKFALGHLFLGGSFLVLALASAQAASTTVSPLYLVVALLLVACGEVVLAPVGIAAFAEAGPAVSTGQTIGLFWLSAALGAALGGQVAALSSVVPGAVYFTVLGVASLTAAAALIAWGGGTLRPRT